MATVEPVLGPAGFVSSPREKLDAVMAHAMLTDSTQLNEFEETAICAIPFIILSHQTRPDEMCQVLETRLTQYLGDYFSSTDVNVTHNSKPDTTFYDIYLAVTVTEDGVKYNLAQAFRLKDGAVNAIVKADLK